MPRKKTEPDESAIPIPKTKAVDAVHTIKYKAPVTVPIEEPEELEPDPLDLAEEEPLEYEEFEEVESRPARKTPNVKGKFKEALNLVGIGNKEIATLRIDRLLNYKEDGNESLRGAETSFVDKINITPAEIKDEKHLTILRGYGPGHYRLMLRHGSTNLGIWKEKIDGPDSVTRTEGEASALNPVPYVIQQSPPIAQKSPLEQLEEAFRLVAMIDKLRGNSGQSQQNLPPAPPPVSEDVQLASILMKDPDIKSKAIKGLLGTAGAETDYIALLIENGDKLFHAFGQMLQGTIESTVIGVQQLRRQQNGQAQAGGQAPTMGGADSDLHVSGRLPRSSELQDQEALSMQVGAANVEANANHGPQNKNASFNGQSPEDQILDSIILQCSRKTPVKIVADRIFETADRIREEAPLESIDGYIQQFAESSLDTVLMFLDTLPNAKPVLEQIHTRDWISALQEEIKKEISQGGEDEQ